MTQIPIAEDLFTSAATGPHLVGSRCRACGARSFPARPACARCTSDDVEVVELPDQGTVWTWTSQEFRPPSPPYTGPEEFERYYVGFVELPGELYVESRFVGFERDPQIGDEVELVLVPFRTDDEGNEVMIHAFAPRTSAGGQDDA
jgi:uncharacterized OB-fold protein